MTPTIDEPDGGGSGRFTRARAADAVLDDDARFWLRHLRLGVVLYVAAALAGVVYLVLTPEGRRRAALEMAVVVALASTVLVVALPARRLVRSPHRAWFFVVWTAFTVAFLLAIAGLDGGAESPLALWLFIPMTYVALAYPWPAVLGTAVGAVGGYSVLALVDPARNDGAHEFVIGAALGLVATVAVAATHNRDRMAAAQQTLLVQLADLAAHDGLTGCLNHRAFHERLDEEVARARRYGRPLALLVVDIDGFKAVNDRFGHVAGDDVLAALGELLRTEARAVDVVGRTGGDEFAVLLPETGGEQAGALAERITKATRTLGLAMPVSVSIGVASTGRAVPVPADARDLVRIADRSLYAAKRRRHAS